MAITSSMLGICVPPESMPAVIGVFADVAALYSSDRPSSVSLSRRMMAAQHLHDLLEAYDARALFYLRKSVAVLDPSQVAQAIRALEQLFARIAGEPTLALGCTARECTAEQLCAAALQPEITPMLEDPQDEDGETLPHVIAYLKAHAAVLRHAESCGFFVVHGHSHHLDGTDA